MKIFKYKNYKHYTYCQKKAFERKFKNVWANEDNIKFISEYIKNYYKGICNGICHGVRQGHEVLWFKKYLGCDVIGTDIGNSKEDYIIQHDFNKCNPEFLNKFDFIYSNSFDHAFDPEKTFNIWLDQLKIGGYIILEYDRRQEHTGEISMNVNKVDPVSIRFDELQKLVLQWNDNVKIETVLDLPFVTQQWRRALIIRKIG